MKSLFAMLLALSLESVLSGAVLRFYILPDDAPTPQVCSSLQAYKAQAPKLASRVLEVDSLAGVDQTTERSVTVTHDLSDKVTEESSRLVPSVSITLPEGFRAKFGKITEENAHHRVLITLDDRILLAPFVHQRVDTDTFLITLGNSSSDEVTSIVSALQSMVKKSAAN
jgi:preprotein translocase subunit SecD